MQPHRIFRCFAPRPRAVLRPTWCAGVALILTLCGLAERPHAQALDGPPEDAAKPGDAASVPDGSSAAATRATGRRSPTVIIRSHTVDRKGQLTLDVDVLSPMPGQRVHLQPLVDGQAVRGFTQALTRNLAVADQYTLQLVVPRRDVVITIVAQVDGSASAKAELRVRQAAFETRPVLHVLSVGVGDYRDPDISRLRYPAKDARDLIQVLQGQRDGLYREVRVHLLSEADATRPQILAALQTLATTVEEDDMAVLFLAGHGTNDADGAYYFLPYDARSDHTTMLSGADLQTQLHQIRGRVVLLLDTCHSGNVLGRRSLNRLLSDLMNENRVVVLAASTGDQTSQESTSWGNGAFTKALIEGLRGAADYAEDGQLSLSELETWVGVRVKELTQGAQTPTLAKPNAAPDYVLADLPRRGALQNPQQLRRRRIAWGTVGAALGVAAAAVVLSLRPWDIGRVPEVTLTFK